MSIEMRPFYKVIEKDGKIYENLNCFLSVIDKYAKKNSLDPKIVSIISDFIFPGIHFSFLSYLDGKFEYIHDDILHTVDENDNVEKYNIENDRERAEMLVNNFRINVTGLVSGETMIGINCVAKGAILLLQDGIIPPVRKEIRIIQKFPDIWKEFLSKCSISLVRFSKFSTTDIAVWLEENSKDIKSDDIADYSDGIVNIFDMGNSTFLQLDSDIQNELLSSSKTFSEIRSLFPRKPGSKATSNTLIFLNYFWEVKRSDINKNFSGLLYNLSENTGLIDTKRTEATVISIDNDKKLGLVLLIYQPFNPMDVLRERIPNASIEKLQFAVRNFTPAGLKSLLQKIIRQTPKTVEGINSEHAIQIVFVLLLTSPGSFVPDIQRFVTGQESALKRLLVTILEDSYCANDSLLLRISILALAAQRLTGFKISRDDLAVCLDLCVDSLLETRYYDHIHNFNKYSKDTLPCVLSITGTNLENVSAVLDILKSFQSDLLMTRLIAKSKGRFADGKSIYKFESNVGVEFCIDQHWAPEIAYLLPRTLINNYYSPELGLRPLTKLFSEIFYSVTGINSRKKTTGLTGHIGLFTKQEKSRFQLAQKALLELKNNERREITRIPESNESLTMEGSISETWIAGMLGAVEMPTRPTTLVTIRPDSIHDIIVIRKPSRDRAGELDEKTESKAAELFENKLLWDGLPLNACRAPIPKMQGLTLYLEEGENKEYRYIFGRGKKYYTFEQISKYSNTFYQYDFSENRNKIQDIVNADIGNFVRLYDISDLVKFLREYQVTEIQRAYTYLLGFSSDIKVTQISKDGGGTDVTLLISDIGACQILLWISYYFPAALKRVDRSVNKFQVGFAPLLWDIRDAIRDAFIMNDENNMDSSIKQLQKWPKIQDSTDRKLKFYQKQALQRMIDRNRDRKRGHFIWITVGLGKTMLVLSYLQYLRENNLLPKYIIYTLPESAMKNVITEISYFGIPINVCIPIKSWKNKEYANYVVKNDTLVPYSINLIEHDYLRRMENELKTDANSSIFIIDEVHKALNESKRTSLALDISKLSVDFVAMTGTPIIDTNTYKLIWWLSQVSDFEVNENNFWVSVNSIISYTKTTDIQVEREEILVEMKPNNDREYRKLVPKSIGGINPYPTVADINAAFNLCYDICDEKMIELTAEYVSKKRGVMLIARNREHIDRLEKLLLKTHIQSDKIFKFLGGTVLNLTDSAVEKGQVPDYKVVLVPKNRSEGYMLTRLNVMITSVYPSNNATREQLEGRINRIGQRAQRVTYITVHTGILTHVLNRHRNAASISAILASLSVKV